MPLILKPNYQLQHATVQLIKNAKILRLVIQRIRFEMISDVHARCCSAFLIGRIIQLHPNLDIDLNPPDRTMSGGSHSASSHRKEGIRGMPCCTRGCGQHCSQGFFQVSETPEVQGLASVPPAASAQGLDRLFPSHQLQKSGGPHGFKSLFVSGDILSV